MLRSVLFQDIGNMRRNFVQLNIATLAITGRVAMQIHQIHAILREVIEDEFSNEEMRVEANRLKTHLESLPHSQD